MVWNMSDELIASFLRSKRASNKTPSTIASYSADMTYLSRWCAEHGRTIETLRRQDIETYLDELLAAGLSPATADRRRRTFVQFYRWAVAEEEVALDPMLRIDAIKIPEDPPPVVTPAEMAALLKACETPRKAGNGPAPLALQFENKRDRAILLTLHNTGMRASELVGIHLDDLNLSVGTETVTVLGKGRRRRTVALVPAVADAIDKYLRHRRKHRLAALPHLWLGSRGPLTDNGMRQMLQRRCDDAGIEHINPHRFRHTFAHRALSKGISDGDLMSIAGWNSPQMLRRYGASEAANRAQAAHREHFSRGD
jgi:site-specific recombinase XerD